MKYQQISTILMLKIENVLDLSSKSFYQDIPDKHVLLSLFVENKQKNLNTNPAVWKRFCDCAPKA